MKRIALALIVVAPVSAWGGSATLSEMQIQAMQARYYTWSPQPDITSYELSLAIGAILPAIACKNSIVCEDPAKAIDTLPPNVKRHFKEEK